MKRPIVIATIGVIIGIIGGMYLKVNTILLFIMCIFLCFLVSNKKIKRYIKVLIKIQAIFFFIVTIIASYVYTKKIESKYEILKEGETGEIIATIKSNPIEKEYVFAYTIKIKEVQGIKNINCILYFKKENNNLLLSYGDIINLKGKIELPSEVRNYGGFNQKLYYKTKGIYGTIYASKIQKIGQEKCDIGKLGYLIRESISTKIRKILPKENADILLAILIGDKEQLPDRTIEEFQNSSLIHILCVSGSHVSFLILAIQKILKKTGRNKKYLLSLFAIIVLIIITGFSASVARACIMGGIMVLSKLLFRKSDTINAIFISLLLLLIYNPFLLFDTGLLLSYGGTIGIIIFDKLLEERIPKNCGKLKCYILKTVFVSYSAQIILIPIIAYLFQSFHPTFFISNLLATPIFEAILYLGCFVLILSFIFEPLFIPLAGILNILLSLFTKLAEISSEIPFAHIKVIKPSIIIVIAYYAVVFIVRYSYIIYQKEIIIRYTERKYKEKLIYLKNKISLKKILGCILAIILVFQSIKLLPAKFNIYFIDVGQGDCTLIRTRSHKTIMIDSGGTEDIEKYDVGKQVLVPYLLARGIKKLDYILISHFHADHCNGFLSIMEELKVGSLLMTKQDEPCEEAKKILELAQKKKIKIVYLKQGQIVSLDKHTKLEILYIGKDTENLNNNSIIARLKYNSFSMLFTGDAEEKQEQAFLKQYGKQNMQVDVLKVGHHGSTTSSSEAFINKIKPKIALIGVGENNNFGHPNKEVIERLENLGSKIYRTDQMGEIILEVRRDESVKIDSKIQSRGRSK